VFCKNFYALDPSVQPAVVSVTVADPVQVYPPYIFVSYPITSGAAVQPNKATSPDPSLTTKDSLSYAYNPVVGYNVL